MQSGNDRPGAGRERLIPALMSGATLRFGSQARARPVAFYVGLAIIFTLAVAANLVWSWADQGVKNASLDLAVRTRFSSPAPDPSIMLVDIDERSLAQLAPTHGRWPWPRSVLAEALAGLSDAGARSIVLNVMLSDPDTDHPQDDAAFADVIAHTPNIAFPVTRLDAKNDALSTVSITRFAGATVTDPAAAARPVALLVPCFTAAYDRLGFNQLNVDADGAVRRYDPFTKGPGFAFPSLPMRALMIEGAKTSITPASFPKGMILNWRNKRGGYQHVSFSDALDMLSAGDGKAAQMFRGKTIIIGPTAPGIATLKGTAAAPLMDDNTIVATAIDDMKHGTYLHLVPAWATAILSVLAIAGIAVVFITGLSAQVINTVFVVLQSGFVAVTVYMASYTDYLVDISTTLLFALSYFTIAKFYAAIHLSALRGKPSFSDFFVTHQSGDFDLLGVSEKSARKSQIRGFVRRLERLAGVRNVLHVDNLFDTGHILEKSTSGLSFIIVASASKDQSVTPDAIAATAKASGIEPRMERISLAKVGADETLLDHAAPLFRKILNMAGDMI